MTRSFLALLSLLIAAVAGLTAGAAPSPAAVTASIEAGVLTLRDDPGGSTDVLAAPYSDPRPDREPFFWIVPQGQGTEARSGPGCSQQGTTVACPYSSVRAISVDGGDGDDRVSVGIHGASESDGPGKPRPCTVPVTFEGGSGNDAAAVECVGQAVVFRGGDGDDGLTATFAAGSVQAHGGPGNDRVGWSYDTINGDPVPIEATHPTSIVLDGGADDDTLGYSGAGAVTIRGGDGEDTINVLRTTEPSDVRGEGGSDTLRVLESRGPVLADAGGGDDLLFISREDPDFARIGGGIVDVRAGAGDDTLQVGDDGDEDLIDCGTGNDHFRFYIEGQTSPPRENRYTNCPVIGAKLLGTARPARRGTAIVVVFRSPAPASVRLRFLGRKAPLGHARAHLKRGLTRVTVRLNRAGRRHLRGPDRDQLLVQAVIRSNTGDDQPVMRLLRIR